ncbi:MAG TPA: DUF4365 domain-containing protein [Bryobacteraceae bacterium]|nr:DUF4365 domain-containing protein [Bryobacteraceae bacterium]
MKRPEQHTTDSQGDAIFRTVFADWAVNASELDYGWDYVVEVFRNGASTGLTFHAQLKSSLHTAYSSHGLFISQSLEREAADYLARQLHQPTFLFHADVNARRLFWTAIQLDEAVLTALEKGETQSLTVRIPTANALPERFDKFLADLTRSKTVVVSRLLLDTKATDFVDAMRGRPIERVAEIVADLHEKGFRLDLQRAHDQMKSRDLPAAITTVKKVISSATEYLEVQFNATLQLGELEWMQLMHSDQPQSLAAARKVTTAEALCQIARRTPRHLHLFAQTTRKAAELGVAVQKAHGLIMIWKGHQRRGDDPLWLTVLSFQVNESLLAAHRKYRQSLRLARAIARSQYRWVISRPIVDIGIEVTRLAKLLENADFRQAAAEYRKSAFQMLKFAAAIATENKSMDELFHAVTTARMVETEQDGEVIRWVRAVVDEWPEDSEYRKNAEWLLERWTDRQKGRTFEGDIQTNNRQIHQNILTSYGIDPTIEPWPSLIELAIKDDDPTRVLKECKEKLIFYHPFSDLLLTRLGLERANRKIIRCRLHGYVVGGRDLDGINAQFNERFCNKCPDRSPRADDWQFYNELEQEFLSTAETPKPAEPADDEGDPAKLGQ